MVASEAVPGEVVVVDLQLGPEVLGYLAGVDSPVSINSKRIEIFTNK